MKKKWILSAGLCVLAFSNVHAQVRGFRDVLVGPVVGGGVNWVTNLNGAEKLMPSGYGGISVIAFSSQYFGWGGQLLYSSEGYRLNYFGNKETVRPGYLRLPLKGYYFMGDKYNRVRPFIQFGPSFAVKVTESVKNVVGDNEANRVVTPLSFNEFDFGLDAGLGLNIKATERTSLNLGLEYYKGLYDAIEDPANHVNENRNVNFNASLLFRIND